jgi:hypothetical protein
MEAWRRIDPYVREPKRRDWFSAWDGLLAGEWFDWG